MSRIRLSDLRPQSTAIISDVEIDGPHKKRLFDLGLFPGTKICCKYIAPAGTPVAFEIKGAVIALRLSDCNKVTVLYDP